MTEEDENWPVTLIEEGYNTYPIKIEDSRKPNLSLHTCEVLLERYGEPKNLPKYEFHFNGSKTINFDKYDESRWLEFINDS